MNLISITFKNLWHRKLRACLTVLGVGVSIAAFVSLVGLASNLEDTLKVTYKTRGTDIVVVEKAAADILTSTIDASYLEKIKRLPEVEDVSAIMLDFSILGFKKYTLVYGWEANSYLFDELKVSGKRPIESNQAIIGILAAKRLKKKIRDEIIIKGFKFSVVGIFQSKSIFEEGSIIIPLNKLQELKKMPDKITLLNIKINKQLSGKENYPDIEKRIKAAQNKIQSLFSDVEVKDIEDFVSTNTPIFTVLNFTWAISVVTLIIAVLGITNTMITSLMERTREIGILIAIGWRNFRIFMLIMLESIFLSFLGGIIGVGLGYILTKILVYSPYFQGVQIHYDISLMVKAALSSIVLGFLAGIYPALKAISISPIEVLRYEH